MGDWRERTELVVGKAGLENLACSTVAIIGLGGVGAYSAEMLCRAGVGHLLALNSTVGVLKTSVMERRLRDINPDVEIFVINEYLEEECIGRILGAYKIDYLVDAIDTLAPKIALIKYCVDHGIPHVTSMGAGAKLDATAIRIADLSKSFNCPLAYILRKKLRKIGISKGFDVVFSEELPEREAIVPVEERNKKSMVGTISYLPAVFGCICAQAAIAYLLRL